MIRVLSRLALGLYDAFVIYGGLILLGTMGIVWTLVAPVIYPFLPRPRACAARVFGRRVAMLSFRFYLGCLALSRRMSFDTTALDALRDAPPLVIAPNHPSMFDALMVISRLPNVACVLKAELLNNFFLGIGARFAGFIRNEPAQRMVQLAIRDIQSGSHLLLYPEGTRTVQDPVNALQGGVGLIAGRAGVPIQTVLIETDTRYLSKGWPLFRIPPMPLRFRVRLGRRFDPPQDAHQFTVELTRYFSEELARGSAFYPPRSLSKPGAPDARAPETASPH